MKGGVFSQHHHFDYVTNDINLSEKNFRKKWIDSLSDKTIDKWIEMIVSVTKNQEKKIELYISNDKMFEKKMELIFL